MATELGKAYVQIVPSAKGIKGGISSALSGEAGSAGHSAGLGFGGRMVSAIKGILVSAGIGAAIKASISEGADLQQSIGGIETLFKDSADIVKQYAAEAYKTAGVSANDYMAQVTSYSASLLQSLGGDTAKSAEIAHMAMVDMSDNANKMGTDMELIQNAYNGFAKNNYTMLDNLKLGYGGTQAEMKRLLADAEALTGVKYDISNLADVYSAIHAIQENLDITGTTAKEASETLSGSMASMKAAFSNVLGQLSLGQDIGPALSGLMDSVFTFLSGNLLPMVGNVLKGLPALLSGALSGAIRLTKVSDSDMEGFVKAGTDIVLELASGVISAAPYLAENAINAVKSFSKAILSTDWKATGKAFVKDLRNSLSLASAEILGSDDSFAKAAVESLLNAAPDIIQCGGDILGFVLQGLTEALPEIATFAMDLINQLAEGLSANIPMVLSVGTGLLNQLVSGIFLALPSLTQSALNIVVTLGTALVESLPQLLESGKSLLENLISGFKQALPSIKTSAVEAVKTLASNIADNLPEIIQSGLDLIGSLATGIVEALPDIAAAVGEILMAIGEAIGDTDWIQLGKDIIGGLIDGIGLMAGALWDAAVNIAESAWKAIKDFFGIASPSKLMRDTIGKQLPAGIAIGIEANTSSVTGAMKDLADITADAPIAAKVQMGMQYDDPMYQKQYSPPTSVPGQLQVSVNIESFNNSREQDVGELADEISNLIYIKLKQKEAALG